MRFVGVLRAWKPSRLVRQTIVTIAGLVAVLSFLLAVGLAFRWQRESECFAAGGKLRGLVTCEPIVNLDHCEVGGERVALGTVFPSGPPSEPFRAPNGALVDLPDDCCECTRKGIFCGPSRCLRLPVR
jgi:hypothetical protein